MTHPNLRISLVDALRGFVILAIMLLHNVERFEIYQSPGWAPPWLAVIDKAAWDAAFFFFGGKAYAIFAFLFGFTFALQFDKRAALGEDFRPRYIWRMLLLLAFGLINSLFYHGDILSLYAVLGMALLPVARLGNRAVLAIVVVLLLQPFAWIELLRALPAPAATLPDPTSWAYFGRARDYLEHGSLWEVWTGNLTNGKVGVIQWSWEQGRLLQIPALFMLGMLACRSGLFSSGPGSNARWRRIGLVALALFIPLFIVTKQLETWVAAAGLRRPLEQALTSWSNVALATVLVAGFTLLYQGAGQRLLARLAPLGRMSLTSYIAQSVVGTALYYGWGFGLYQVVNTSGGLLIGVVLATLQIWFSTWWLRHHAQGPLEALWHRATWIGRPAAAIGDRPRQT